MIKSSWCQRSIELCNHNSRITDRWISAMGPYLHHAAYNHANTSSASQTASYIVHVEMISLNILHPSIQHDTTLGKNMQMHHNHNNTSLTSHAKIENQKLTALTEDLYTWSDIESLSPSLTAKAQLVWLEGKEKRRRREDLVSSGTFYAVRLLIIITTIVLMFLKYTIK